jgi:hypothetical protein
MAKLKQRIIEVGVRPAVTVFDDEDREFVVGGHPTDGAEAMKRR